MEALAGELSVLTGLDQATVRSQLVPYISTIGTRGELLDYLDGLLGPGQQQRELAVRLAAVRFSTASLNTAPSSGTPSGLIWDDDENVDRHGRGNLRFVPRQSGAAPRPAAGSSQTQARKAPRRDRARPSDARAEDGLSEPAKLELAKLRRELSIVSGTSASHTGRRCFCQGRQHALSPYVPICPGCALIVCHANSPLASCPSCQYGQLASLDVLEASKASLALQVSGLLESERLKRAQEEQQRLAEAAVIRFPGLDSITTSTPARAAATGYADRTGGVGRAVDKAYARSQAEVEHKTLSIGKSGKLTVATSRAREPSALSRPEREDPHDGLVGWSDPFDDGVRLSMD
ncbi:uncharacterized protein L969DRAFT_20307 [Mixia osmundae IAM 14324]|uniref:TRIP4/RQT4 C2HC5-type zinc finger domain-containing protein n=1 Tax=Mixia osmundae (strain CBS 9802 / IAM 14324 / JCM 22182 / KY 12970) TaxID=764103 RepID=G7EB51_MIXOS|nr:uncharacterized protein L969DRAFT_20307 [Mixia osmundae IAM 14324]KEI36570.1 hypothetical protein L969DRAFT_20307 [Mixia osmundae IAM 14324]GAB00062.1 hypothetical protein E5Q_06764 [Mixia osmundae IAM 14324]